MLVSDWNIIQAKSLKVHCVTSACKGHILAVGLQRMDLDEKLI